MSDQVFKSHEARTAEQNYIMNSLTSQNPFYTRKVTDCGLCFLCQGQSRSDLRCPYNKECHHTAYHTLETDLINFVSNDIPLPLGVNPQCLDNGSGIANTLLSKKASYHNTCWALFRSTMLHRHLRKRDKPKTEKKNHQSKENPA